MRPSARELSRPAGRAAAGRPRTAGAPAPHRPVQLDLFSQQPAALRESVKPAVRPVLVPRSADPDAARFELLRRLNRMTGGRLHSLALTDNRRTILSVRPVRPGTQLDLRLHRSFLEASEGVLQAVAAFVESKRGTDRSREALVVIRDHFSRYRTVARTRRLVLRPQGAALDLREVAEELNQRYFDGRLKVAITWGKAAGGNSQPCRRRARTSSLQLGSYSYEDGLIRLHRVLDHPGVPGYVVEAVVYHELLHADMPPEVRGGRRQFHTPEFRRRERLFRHLEKADRWIQEHLPELLESRRAVKRSRK
jgi:predicted metal-dependent hydrolase